MKMYLALFSINLCSVHFVLLYSMQIFRLFYDKPVYKNLNFRKMNHFDLIMFKKNKSNRIQNFNFSLVNESNFYLKRYLESC